MSSIPCKEEFDIYKELQKIEVEEISKIGKGLDLVFKGRDIRSFITQKTLKNKMYREMCKEVNNFSKKEKIKVDSVNIQLNKLCKKKRIKSFDESMLQEGLDKQYKEALEKEKNKKLNKTIDDRTLTRKDCLKYLIKKQKEFEKKPKHFKSVEQQKMKSRRCVLYYPDYSSVSKHVPLIKFQPPKKEKPQKHLMKSNLKSFITTLYKTPNNAIPFEKYSSRNNNVFGGKPNGDCTFSPKTNKISRNISAPNFKKMTSREKEPRFNPRLPQIISYSPNYDFVLPNNTGYKKIDQEMEKKKYLIKKLWGSFDVPSEYIVVPSINEE